ncbi:YeeE/YedE [Duganella sp. Leaf126]|uniref:YeeE/YedE family protein n=1 Tax=Duganella sp. Leaf126 TaxID=1736266 RepID=UPI0007007817|nr:YeeE/YedE family protein [Duganella sp. Leaf126]KQQ45265.1 YeeE/YedE [Duganella sp. Leaf126]
MTIDWINFAPWPALAGGLLIGAACAALILFNGKIAGISGVLGGLLGGLMDRLSSHRVTAKGADLGWRAAFIGGLLLAPVVYGLAAPLPASTIDTDTVVLISAGLLVGAGTRYGAGCTSGHGVCGLSRRSPRSMAATATFMLAGFVTVYVVRHVLT